MRTAFIMVIIIFSTIDIYALKKMNKIKDIFVYIGFMVIVAAFGIIYLSNTFQKSIAGYILDFFKIKIH